MFDEGFQAPVQCLATSTEYYIKTPRVDFTCLDSTFSSTESREDKNLQFNLVNYYKHTYLRHGKVINVESVVLHPLFLSAENILVFTSNR